MTPEERDLQRQRAVLQHVLRQTLRRQPRLIPLLAFSLVAAQVVLPALARGGGADPTPAVILAFGHLDHAIRSGDWWRLLSSWTPHHGAFHLLGNVLFLMLLGRPVEAAYGPGRTWLICVLSGLAGSLLALNAGTPVMVGASGVVMGLCGATIALGVRLWPFLAGSLRMALVFVPGLFLLLRLLLDGALGEAEHLNPYAHQGGALAGFVLGMRLQPYLPMVQGERLSRGWLRLGVALATLVFAAANGEALAHLRRPARLPSVLSREINVEGRALALPANVQRGLLRRGQCVGDATDVDWALAHGQTVCFPLEPFGMLLLDRRERLLSLDANDLAAMRAADQTGRFVQSEPNIMLYPLHDDLLWVLEAPEPALRWHASALIPLLPPPGSAVVRTPPLSGQWLLPWRIALALLEESPRPQPLDLGDGVQLLIGPAAALQDPHGRDVVPLAVAGQTRQFARALPGMMLLPLPNDRMAALLGPDSRLDDFAARLHAILPPAIAMPAPSPSAWLAWLALPFQTSRALPAAPTPAE